MVALGRRLFSLIFIIGALISARAAFAQNPGDDERTAPVDPREYAGKVRLAEGYEQGRDFTSAVRVYQQLYHTNPSDEFVFERLTQCLMYLRRFDEAEQMVKYRLDRQKTLELQLLWATIEAKLNKPGQARMAFEEAEKMASARECSQLFPIVNALMEVSYNKEAMELLGRMRKLATSDADLCIGQIAGLYLHLGDYDRAATEFINLIKVNEGNVGMVEQRLAQYLTDSMSRGAVLTSLENAIKAEG